MATQISKEQIEKAYQNNARFYDFAVKLFYPLIGLRINEYRRRAVSYLDLKPGDYIIDLGCGTGLCFPLLMEKIGPNGTLLGVDISSKMLSVAKERVKRAGWPNVQLLHWDIEKFQFPDGIDGLISIGVFGYLEERSNVLEKISNALVHNGKLVIVDGKRPDKWPPLLFKIFVRLSSPYGLTDRYFDNDTPEIVSRLFKNITFEEMYGGLIYITSGTKYQKAA
ncbi:MAG: methyltransferase domain-containing protein [Gammaproteobacteria bacterium]|nr:methyltransferase domain-containing protein [Gammaproteobacteria bacterium]MDH3857549.1 methyltransferase domain-containing protein [Gammaproteobacteria bacterium]